MGRYELWVMVVGGEDPDERVIYQGDSLKELEAAIQDADDEVTCDVNKYFEILTPVKNVIFNSYDEFLENQGMSSMRVQERGLNYKWEMQLN